MSYTLMDLVCERANEKDWCLIFDSGPRTDMRTMIWEYPLLTPRGEVTELEMVFGPDGRLLLAEKRRGTMVAAIDVGVIAGTDVCIEALGLMAGPGFGCATPEKPLAIPA